MAITNRVVIISFLIMSSTYAMSHDSEKVVETERLYARRFTLVMRPIYADSWG